MESIKFLHQADTHIAKTSPYGSSKVFEAAIAFRGAIDLVLEDHLDFILVAGDMFDNPRVSNRYIQETLIELKRLTRKGIPCIIIAGNHDKSSRTLRSPISHLSVMANVIVMREISTKVLKINTRSIAIHGVPLS